MARTKYSRRSQRRGGREWSTSAKQQVFMLLMSRPNSAKVCVSVPEPAPFAYVSAELPSATVLTLESGRPIVRPSIVVGGL